MPSTTAVARSSTTVARKVSPSTAASPREARARARRLDTSIIRTAVAMSTPARAASGIQATTSVRASTTTSSTSECTTAASRERAPERTLTAVRAIAAVAGMPPSSGEARFASPWPKSSRSGSCREDTLIASATVAESRLSSAARAATATAGTASTRRSLQDTDGTVRVNSRSGRAPIVSTGTSARRTATVATTTPSSATGTAGRRRESTRIAAATPTLMATGARSGLPNHSRTAATADTTTCSGRADRPSAEGTCWRAMRAAMPRVNPSMTGSGMNRTYLPAPARPITTRITPAMRPTTSTPSAPWVATIGTRTTVIAPVGPETCT